MLAFPLAGAPGQNFDPRSAQDIGLTRQIVEGDAFRHVLIRGHRTGGSELHVYIEGDGVPYAFGVAARDPTSQSRLMLRLMGIDPVSSIYLGRPCYEGLYADRNCSAHYWTDRRFSPEVVASMRQALADAMQSSGAKNAVLIGHSGGGALAVLLAHQVAGVSGVITLGGNLDTGAWTRLHQFAPLTGSANPALLGRLPDTVSAVHLVGSKDRVTPPKLVAQGAAATGGTVIVFEGFTHTCCWARIWPGPISRLAN
jgi:hypothetical protein